jgi:hypothetical protein
VLPPSSARIWFLYVDQPVTDRRLDGWNSRFGLMGIIDVSFGGFVEAVRAANEKAQGQR